MHDRAHIHPPQCRFCGGTEFWDLGSGPVQSLSFDRKTGKHSCYWSFHATVRCTKCHATFNAELPPGRRDGAGVNWHLGRGWPPARPGRRVRRVLSLVSGSRSSIRSGGDIRCHDGDEPDPLHPRSVTEVDAHPPGVEPVPPGLRVRVGVHARRLRRPGRTELPPQST